MPLAPVSKSIWSNCVEALCEYCRIVWDIFPSDRLLRFIVSDCTSTNLNSWEAKEQTTAHVWLVLVNKCKFVLVLGISIDYKLFTAFKLTMVYICLIGSCYC